MCPEYGRAGGVPAGIGGGDIKRVDGVTELGHFD